jgi:1-phosphatidylinositol-3-phosphate 5-kinase
VLLDENLLERVAAADAPLCVAPAAADAVAAAVWRDTAFLARVGVMDYSLLIGVQPRQRQLACGIVDYLRQYTWDKQLETYVKSSSAVLALGGGSGAAQPTVISPKQYARRFRKAMRSYFVVVPDVHAPSEEAAAAAQAGARPRAVAAAAAAAAAAPADCKSSPQTPV